MAKKKSIKKTPKKIDVNAQEKVYLTNIINNLSKYAKENEGNSLGDYFNKWVEKNKQRLKDLE